MAEYDVKREIAAIGAGMEGLSGLRASEALRVLAYLASFIGAHDLSERGGRLRASES